MIRHSRRAAAPPASVVVDARFLGFSGIGRVTEALLRGLGEVRPPGEWIVWGPPAVEELVWEGARPVVTTTYPLALGGQRQLFSVPRGDLVLHLHAVRPLSWWRRAAVLIQDTTPLRYGPRWRRPLWWVYFELSARTADVVMANSAGTRERLVRELRLAPSTVTTVPLPVDTALAERVRARRMGTAPDARMLYVGQFAPHKNLRRAVRAFEDSGFRRAGGTFVLAGARPAVVDEVRAMVREEGATAVEVVPRCSDDELAELYATSSLVVLPSIEEGFGLPVLEAMVAGVPTCCSDIPSLREASRGLAEYFDPRSEASISSAIDRTWNLARAGGWAERDAAFRAGGPVTSDADFTAAVLDAIGVAVDRRNGRSTKR